MRMRPPQLLEPFDPLGTKYVFGASDSFTITASFCGATQIPPNALHRSFRREGSSSYRSSDGIYLRIPGNDISHFNSDRRKAINEWKSHADLAEASVCGKQMN